MKAIIGSGIAGACLSNFVENPVVIDKARFPGGRLSSKPFPGGSFCDLGATFFKNEVEIQKDNLEFSFSVLDWLKGKGIGSKSYSLGKDKMIYYSDAGMKFIPESLLKGCKVLYGHELISTSRNQDGGFQLRFLNGEQLTADKLYITAPIPQALNLLPEGEDKKKWEIFLSPYGDYRKTLVAAGYWKNPSPSLIEGIGALKQFSFLDKNNDAEYISVESRKAMDSSGLVLMIQFSELFSNTFFENWRNPDRTPTEFCANKFQMESTRFFQKVISQNIEIPQPDNYRIHKWRYAQSKNSLLGKEGTLNLDSPKFMEYLDLVQESGIVITGDWLYGPRIERIVAGVIHTNYE